MCIRDRSYRCSLADDTPEGRSIVELCLDEHDVVPADAEALAATRGHEHPEFEVVPFTAETRMSGIDVRTGPGPVVEYRKGAADAVARWVTKLGGDMPVEVTERVAEISNGGGTPLVVAVNDETPRVLGVIQLSDVVKPGMTERFAQLREMGIRTVMVTGDNPLTAKAIAAEAGVDHFVAEATPEDKLALIRAEQSGGRLVAMTGDGTNDAPALAQADVGVAMNSGCLLYTSPSPRDGLLSRMPSSA